MNDRFPFARVVIDLGPFSLFRASVRRAWGRGWVQFSIKVRCVAMHSSNGTCGKTIVAIH